MGVMQAIAERVKAVTLRFPGYGGGSSQGFSSLFTQLINGVYAGSGQNWAAQVRDPSLSSLVMAAAGWVGRRLPEATLQVVELDGEDNEEPIPDHALVQLFNRPNPYYDAAGLWEHFAFSWLLDGNVYWLIRPNAMGGAAELWPLPHWMVFPRWRNESEYLGFYEYNPNGESVFFKPEQIVHFRAGISDPDNTRKGISPLRSVLRELFTDGELANYSAALIKNSGVPPMLVTTKEMSSLVTQEKAQEFSAELQRRITGDNRGKALFHTWPLDVQHLSFKPDEMDLRKLRYMSEERFCAVIGLNPMTLKFGAASETQTYNNVESFRRQDIEDYMCPLWMRVAGTIERQLLPMFEQGDDHHVKFDTASVVALREQDTQKHDRVRADVLAGLLKVKDAQMMLGWTPDDQADYYLRPSNLVEVKDGEIRMATPPVDPNAPKPGEEKPKPKELPAAKSADLDYPATKDIDAAVKWWKEIAPEAADLIDAKVE